VTLDEHCSSNAGGPSVRRAPKRLLLRRSLENVNLRSCCAGSTRKKRGRIYRVPMILGSLELEEQPGERLCEFGR